MNTPTPIEQHTQKTFGLMINLKSCLANAKDAADEADKLFKDQNFKYSSHDKEMLRTHIEDIQNELSKI